LKLALEMDKLESIARKLKEKVGEYEPVLFARKMTTLINGITLPWNTSLMRGLVSPFRQLFYLFNLNATSPLNTTYRTDFNENTDWPELVAMLIEMEDIHRNEYGELKPFAKELFAELDAEEVFRRRQIGSSTYTAFFHVGPLHYEEQAIEKIVELFRNFNTELGDQFGWDSTDILAFYDCLDGLRQTKQDRAFLKQPRKELSKEEFAENVMASMKGGSTFQEAMMNASPMPTGMFEYVADPSSVNTFTLSDLEGCSRSLVELLLKELTISRNEVESFLFFSQPNQLYKNPIYDLNDGQYMIIDHRVLLSAMSMFLQQKCGEIIKKKNRITVARDKYLERKVEEIFTGFYQLDPQAKIFPSYFIEKGGSERDLLILSKDTALIVEAKAGKVREPMYDPDKAYTGIWYDFKETIDYGYTQTYSVKKKFLEKQPFEIYDDKKNTIQIIDPSLYKNIFSIIVTYNKFGHVECDLQLMLDLYDEDDQFPWAVCVDDLEIFILAMQKLKFSSSDFNRFLRQRENMHGNLIVNDEGQVTGHFLKHKRFMSPRGTCRFSPDDDYIYDSLYSTGLGFKNERGLARKQDLRFRKIV
jgi:hypothetical protein